MLKYDFAGALPTQCDDRSPEHEMAAAFTEALGRAVSHRTTPLAAIGNPDMHAMWAFLNGGGYHVDIEALHGAHPDIAWTSFRDWTQHTFRDADDHG